MWRRKNPKTLNPNSFFFPCFVWGQGGGGEARQGESRGISPFPLFFLGLTFNLNRKITNYVVCLGWKHYRNKGPHEVEPIVSQILLKKPTAKGFTKPNRKDHDWNLILCFKKIKISGVILYVYKNFFKTTQFFFLKWNACACKCFIFWNAPQILMLCNVLF